MLVSYDSVRRNQESEAIKLITSLRREMGIVFKDKRVLDVGCEIGCKSRAMKECGADVYVVEPNSEALEYAYIANNKKFNSFVQDLPKELFGTFDMVTMFLYRVLPGNLDTFGFSKELGEQVNKMQLQVTKTTAKLIKPDGEVIIEISNLADDYYLYKRVENIAPLMWQLKQVFEDVSYEKITSYDSIFIRAKKPLSNIMIDSVKEEDVVFSSLPKSSELINEGIYFEEELYEELKA